ncbi:MAG: type III pantothenate kinase [Xanthomonadales bacterium]|nr:type III pantothenate kinase [Xanthomonadales bacterium]
MKLCLDVGNSHIYGGVYDSGRALLTFRKASKLGSSSDEYGMFFRTVLRENGIDPNQVIEIALCSVVPEAVYAISAACQKYFDIRPFILQAGVKTGLKVQYRNPLEVGADRIANAIAGVELFPNKNLIIVDLGTATTLCAVGEDRSYRGGVILPGLKMSMQALESGTSKLGSVEIIRLDNCLGRTTASSIQSGLYFGHLGALREIMQRIQLEEFDGQRPKVIATGGFASLFDGSGLFDQVVQDLVLRGLLGVLKMNAVKSVV